MTRFIVRAIQGAVAASAIAACLVSTPAKADTLVEGPRGAVVVRTGPELAVPVAGPVYEPVYGPIVHGPVFAPGYGPRHVAWGWGHRGWGWGRGGGYRVGPSFHGGFHGGEFRGRR